MPLPARMYPSEGQFLKALDEDTLKWYRAQYEILLDDLKKATPAERFFLALINAELARRDH